VQRMRGADVHPLDTSPFLPRLVAGLAAAVFVWGVAAELGNRVLQGGVRDGVVRAALGAPLGYALIGSLIALLGFAHAATPRFCVGLLALIAIVRLPSYAAHARSVPGRFRAALDRLRTTTALDRAALLVSAFALVTALTAAALPAVWWDPIAYHLPIAATALASGAFAFDPGMVQSAFPALGEAAALPAFALAGSAGAAMATLFAGISLALLCALLARWAVPGTGLLAFALMTSSALWLWLGPSFYVDVPFALFVVAAIATPLLTAHADVAVEFIRPSAGRVNSTATHALVAGALCGALAGAAAAVKYPGIVAAIIVLGMLIALGPRPRSFAFGGFAFGFVVLAVGWYARNFAQIGDPVYPFLTGALGFPAALTEFAARYLEMTRHWCGTPASAADFVLLPWRLLAQPWMFCGDQGFALRLGAIFAFLGVAVVRRLRPLALAAVVLTIVWFFGSQQWRFLLPALVLYAAIVAAGTAGAGERLRAAGAALLLTLGAAGVALNWLPAMINQASSSIVPGFAYIAARESPNAYLERRLETFGASEWLRAHGATRQSVISLDDVRTYYFWGGIAWANPYYQQEWSLIWSLPSAQRYSSLRAHSYRYLLVNATPEYVHRTPTGVNWDVLADDVKGGVLSAVYQSGGVAVYEIMGQRAR